MTKGVGTIIFPVSDLTAAKALYSTLLGMEPGADYPYYVGFDAPGQHIGLNPNGHREGMVGPTVFWHVTDIEAEMKGLLAAGATENVAIKDVGGGRLIGSVTDADGNVIGLLQPGSGGW